MKTFSEYMQAWRHDPMFMQLNSENQKDTYLKQKIQGLRAMFNCGALFASYLKKGSVRPSHRMLSFGYVGCAILLEEFQYGNEFSLLEYTLKEGMYKSALRLISLFNEHQNKSAAINEILARYTGLVVRKITENNKFRNDELELLIMMIKVTKRDMIRYELVKLHDAMTKHINPMLKQNAQDLQSLHCRFKYKLSAHQILVMIMKNEAHVISSENTQKIAEDLSSIHVKFKSVSEALEKSKQKNLEDLDEKTRDKQNKITILHDLLKIDGEDKDFDCCKQQSKWDATKAIIRTMR